jgi:hypothetical protein
VRPDAGVCDLDYGAEVDAGLGHVSIIVCCPPPLATERRERLPDGRLLYRLRYPRRDDTTSAHQR